MTKSNVLGARLDSLKQCGENTVGRGTVILVRLGKASLMRGQQWKSFLKGTFARQRTEKAHPQHVAPHEQRIPRGDRGRLGESGEKYIVQGGCCRGRGRESEHRTIWRAT